MTVRGIAFLDIDGTLVPSGSSSSFLAARIGHQDVLDEAEKRYARGELSNWQVSELDAHGWRGVDVATVDRWLQDLPTMNGIEDVVAWCRSHDIEPALASLAWQPVSDFLARRYGFATTGGPRIGVSGSAYDGSVVEHFDEYDKRDRAIELAAQLRVPLDSCCAIGDSRSDVPLFRSLTASVALNADEAARSAATVTIDTLDLADLLPWLRSWHDKIGRTF